MNQFDDREKAFEAKFHIDGELAFKVNARRDKLLGRWVAEKIGLAGAALEDYANEVVVADLKDPNHHTMIGKLLADLQKAGASVDEIDLRHQMEKLFHQAQAQVMAEVGDGLQTISPA